jgi:hypothetical protein
MIQSTIYALACLCHPEKHIQYVGKTAMGTDTRRRGHFQAAASGSHAPVAAWIRTHGTDNIVSVTLETLPDAATDGDLSDAEGTWIRMIRGAGFNLLNVTVPDGGRITNRSLPPTLMPPRTPAFDGLLW